MGIPNCSSGSYFMPLWCGAVSNKGSGPETRKASAMLAYPVTISRGRMCTLGTVALNKLRFAHSACRRKAIELSCTALTLPPSDLPRHPARCTLPEPPPT